MKIIETGFAGLVIVEPVVFKDDRGYFFEGYNQHKFSNLKIDTHFVQDNQSKSNYGVLRGLHYQLEPYAQTKLIRVLEGKIYDVVVDIRKGSPTFGKTFSRELSSENFNQLYIPKGFAHGFSVLSKTAIILYKCDSLYNPKAERGIRFNDPDLAIDWQIPVKEAILSPKDLVHPLFKDAEMNFIF
jgi:dTDP-4-dehydrorhamnose 3,5-epimerase